MDGVYGLCLTVSPLGVVASELIVCEGGETVDGVGTSILVVVAEDAGGERAVGVIGVIGLPIEAVCPNVRGNADVLGHDGYVMFVGEEEGLSQLGHHGRRSRREVEIET